VAAIIIVVAEGQPTVRLCVYAGPVGQNGVVADGARIRLADFVSKLSCH